ncbi:MAG: OmpA family protein [Bryobacteraceae bacterium]|nr:OmpA family protein [Bryobacteraceae bacterium]
MNCTSLFAASLLAVGILSAQPPSPPANDATGVAAEPMPIYRVTVTARTARAINYQHRSGATKIDFRGTELLPKARGEAKVESKQGYIEIEVEFDDLEPATLLGTEYLTYVMWAITAEGRTANLGEVLLNGSKSKLNVTTELQVFGLLVTAEPYFSVTRPSDFIVLENFVRVDTKGKVEEIDAKYELLKRGEYQRLSNPLALKIDSRQPLELYEARNAVQIARAMGADRFATETFQKAEKSLAQAEAYQSRNAGTKPVTMTARETVQTAEDARAIAVKRQEEEALNAERQSSATREAQAESDTAVARSETDRVTRDAERARREARADSDRLTQEKNAQAIFALAEADRVKRETDLRTAASATAAAALKQENDAQSAAARAESDRLRRENEEQRAANQAELDRGALVRAKLESEQLALRAQLLAQFNSILETRDTARGLIVNLSDVLFDTGQFSLRALAREKLSKVAGIVSGHPGLRLDIEGHTDSVGGDEYNQRLSEQRGSAVSAYLTEQGMPASALSSKGFGKTQPVATNDSAAGRQLNRRVELVISGDLIGKPIASPGGRRP